MGQQKISNWLRDLAKQFSHTKTIENIIHAANIIDSRNRQIKDLREHIDLLKLKLRRIKKRKS